MLAAVERELGEMEWYDARAATRSPRVLARSLLTTPVHNPSLIRRPRALYHARLRTRASFDAMSGGARAHAVDIAAPWVLQTQGLFNGRVQGRPHFIYTDSTGRVADRTDPTARRSVRSLFARERELYQRATMIFAASGTARASIIHDYAVPEARVRLAQTGLNVSSSVAPPERDPDAFDVLFVGVDWERKGGPDVLRAFDRLRSAIPHATLTVVGPRPPAAAPDGARFLGRLPPSELPRHLAAASVFCLPSHHEPAGIAYSEAAAWELPVIATTAGDIPDRVIDGRTGILVAPGDVDGLTAALLLLAENPMLRRQFGSAGRAHTLRTFTWERVASVIADGIRATQAAASEPQRGST